MEDVNKLSWLSKLSIDYPKYPLSIQIIHHRKNWLVSDHMLSQKRKERQRNSYFIAHLLGPWGWDIVCTTPVHNTNSNIMHWMCQVQRWCWSTKYSWPPLGGWLEDLPPKWVTSPLNSQETLSRTLVPPTAALISQATLCTLCATAQALSAFPIIWAVLPPSPRNYHG